MRVLEPGRWRPMLAFTLLGTAGLAVLVRLAWLQAFGSPALASTVERQRMRTERWPAPRGTVVDRHGELCAYDRPVLEVRAETHVDLTSGEESAGIARFARELAADLELALRRDGAGQSAAARARLEQRIGQAAAKAERRQSLRPAKAGRPARLRQPVDFLVASDVDSAAILTRLEQLDAQRQWLRLQYQRQWQRTYPEPELTLGPVGFVGELDLGHGKGRAVLRGMEGLAGLQPLGHGQRPLWQDALAQRYWAGASSAPPAPAVLETTLDLGLQRHAQDELERAVAAVAADYGTQPDWGALCLAELATGDVLAMASWRQGAPAAAAQFAPMQCLVPPGSVVKPLVFSLALERGVLDWEHDTFDCRPTDARGWQVPHARRWIRDSHACEVLTPREILVQSSNVGAVQVGLRLGREGLDEYLARYRWGTKTATRWPDELAGACRQGLRSLPELTFWGYVAPSLSFGYEYNVTPVQLLRAYVTLLSRRERDLRLYRRVAGACGVHELESPPAGAPFLSEETLGKLVDAMAGVVSDEPHATGARLRRELGSGGPVPVAGKTGTSEYHEQRRGGSVMVRTSSFAGFAPIEKPRFVAVCILQKAGASSFWGGRYAAPAAGRLLLRALAWPSATTPARVSAQAAPGRAASGLAAVGRQ